MGIDERRDDADIRRIASFVTNFGNWTLPADAAAAMGAAGAPVEWVHDTGELILLGGIPHVGTASMDVPSSFAADVPAFLGGTSVWAWLVERLNHFDEPAGDDSRFV